MKASMSCSAPSSRVNEVIRQASIPQGTIHSNGCRSLLTLTANPWVVTPRLTWTPIEPILRSLRRPDARQPLDRAGLDAVGAERRDHHPLHAPDVVVDVVAVRAQAHDRVADELAGAVVGDAAAAVGLGDLDSLHPVPVLAHRQLVGGRAPALRVDGRVLEQEQHVRDRAGLARGLEALLQRAGFVVGDLPRTHAPQLAHALSLAGARRGGEIRSGRGRPACESGPRPRFRSPWRGRCRAFRRACGRPASASPPT